MKKNVWAGLAVGVMIVCMAELAQATPKLYGNNYYELIEVSNVYGTNNTWTTANTSAYSSVFNGVNGHLATITSQAENDFIFSLVHHDSSEITLAWLGGHASLGWLDGPEMGQNFTYTNWGGIEPNDPGYVFMYTNGILYPGVTPGQWGDSLPDGTVAQDIPIVGYFVEYENVSAAPEPATIVLMCTGLVGLIGSKVLRHQNVGG